MNRRELGRLSALALGGITLTQTSRAQPSSNFAGVILGLQGFCFKDRPLDAAVQAMTDIGAEECEISWRHMEPDFPDRNGAGRDKVRQWRLRAPLSQFEAAGNKFRAAGIDPYGYTLNMKDDFTDAEIVRGFEMAQALRVKEITCSANISTVKRIDTWARKFKIRVGLHNHNRIARNELATAEDFAAARRGTSDYIGIAFDIGHFVAAGFDPVSYVAQNHGSILLIHVKDRKRKGPNTPFGEGDTPIQEVLRLIRDKKYPIRANIEYEYNGADTMAEVRKCFDYCKQALMS